jgi:hypothetical protein
MSDLKKYRINEPHYRSGTYYPSGSIVSVPAEEKPSKTWVALEAAAATKAEPPAKDTKPTRASDKSVA